MTSFRLTKNIPLSSSANSAKMANRKRKLRKGQREREREGGGEKDHIKLLMEQMDETAIQL